MATNDRIDYQLQRFLTKPKLCEYIEDEEVLKSVYSLIDVTHEVASEHLRVFSEEPDDHLILVHYLTPSEAVNHVRGIIIDVQKVKIVCMSFPYTDDLTIDKMNIIEGDLSTYSVTPAHEGTIIRYFKGSYTEKWYMSTHRRISGRKSSWSGPTFGEMFDGFWKDPESLAFEHEDKCYVFLLSHIENRLVCTVDKSTLYYLGLFDGVKYAGQLETNDDQDVLTQIREQAKDGTCILGKSYSHFSQQEKLVDYTRSLDWDRYTGVLLSRVGENGFLDCYKFTSEEYLEKREVRGNEPNFRLRYLELRDVNREKEFRDLFPEREEYFDQVDKDVRNIARYLKDLYHERYIRRQFSILPQEDHHVLDDTYRSYDSNLSIGKNVRSTLKHSTPRQINAIIKHMYLAKKKSEEECNDAAGQTDKVSPVSEEVDDGV